MSTMPDKATLRQTLKAARLALSTDGVAEKSAAIVAQVEHLLMEAKPELVHCFEPMTDKREVDVSPLVPFLEEWHPEPTQYTSRPFNGWWQIVTLDGQSVYRQPAFDCIIVPMLGFDDQTLHRLGNGGGYYDRMLGRQSAALKIGVCFELGRLTAFPATSHDVPLDCVVTEERIYTRPGTRSLAHQLAR
jgi:5,10-methenyltetrahydrofolate synthetase